MATTPLPSGLGAPADRALAAAGITSVEDVAAWREPVLSGLHGVGPRAVAGLRIALARAGLDFAPQGDDAEDVIRIDAWLADLDGPQATSLRALRATLRKVLPHADEGWSYGLPAILLQGSAVAGYGAASDHCSYLPHSGTVLDTCADVVADLEVSKGALRFPPGSTLPVGLIRTLVAARLRELGAVGSGIRREYHKDGRIKAEGPMRKGQMHGAWAWYRADGTLLRTGSFRDGDKAGVWTTWLPDGTPAD